MGSVPAPADRGLPDRRARDRVEGRLHLHPRRVPRRVRGAAGGGRRGRAAGLFGDVEITVHRGAGAYICGEETALLDSLEGRRGQPRPRPPFPPVQGLYNAPTQINNVCTIATVPIDHRARRRGVREDRRRDLAGHGDLLDLRQRREARQLRARARHADAGADLRLGGGIPDGRELKAVIPGGSSVPALTPDQIDVPLDYDSLGASGDLLRRRRR